MTRRDLADQTGLSYPYISQLETAYRLPSPKAMQVLARVLRIPTNELFDALPNDADPAEAVDPRAAPRAAAAHWIANPIHKLAQQPPPPKSEDAADVAIRALEALPPFEPDVCLLDVHIPPGAERSAGSTGLRNT